MDKELPLGVMMKMVWNQIILGQWNNVVNILNIAKLYIFSDGEFHLIEKNFFVSNNEQKCERKIIFFLFC